MFWPNFGYYLKKKKYCVFIRDFIISICYNILQECIDVK